MVAAYNHARDRGWNPVNTGRAPWLPSVYEHAVAFTEGVVSELAAQARQRDETRARVKRG